MKGSYLKFINYMDNDIKVIFELGSRDLLDAIELLKNYKYSKIYSFECNPDCLVECNNNIKKFNEFQKKNIILIDKAVSLNDGIVKFFPFDLEKYNNMGASSLLKIDFSNRSINDPDYNRRDVQKEIEVSGIRLDTFLKKNNISNIDLLCIDLQGYELNAIKSLGKYICNVKYIITECSICSTYINGASFKELNNYLNKFNFKYKCSNLFKNDFPNLNLKGYSEFDALFINTKLI